MATRGSITNISVDIDKNVKTESKFITVNIKGFIN